MAKLDIEPGTLGRLVDEATEQLDSLLITLRVTKPVMEDAAYNYALARMTRAHLHENLDRIFDEALESLRTKDDSPFNVPDPGPDY